MKCPPQINKNVVLQYDDFNLELYESLPEFIKDKIKNSEEFRAMNNPEETSFYSTEDDSLKSSEIEELPF